MVKRIQVSFSYDSEDGNHPRPWKYSLRIDEKTFDGNACCLPHASDEVDMLLDFTQPIQQDNQPSDTKH